MKESHTRHALQVQGVQEKAPTRRKKPVKTNRPRCGRHKTPESAPLEEKTGAETWQIGKIIISELNMALAAATTLAEV